MCNPFNLTKMAAAVLLAVVWTSGARAGPADTMARQRLAEGSLCWRTV
jgi:Mn2+/Fe2+ NRAMP family transporter